MSDRKRKLEAPADSRRAHPNSNVVPAAAAPVTLYKHALECVFDFLELNSGTRLSDDYDGSYHGGDLRTVVLVSKLWRAAVLSMRPIEASSCIWDSIRIPGPVPSLLLARHINVFPQSRVGLCDMPFVTAAFPNLTSLDLASDDDDDDLPAGLLSFPAQLNHVHLRDWSSDSKCANAVMRALASLQYLASFHYWVDGKLRNNRECSAELDFSLLHQAPKLANFHMAFAPKELTEKQIHDLRSLPHQTSVPVCFDSKFTKRIVKAPHNLQWTSLNYSVHLDADWSDSLRNWTSLTSLRLHIANYSVDVSCLATVKNLETLFLYSPSDEKNGLDFGQLQLLAVVKQLVHLQHLHLYDFVIDVGSVSKELLRALPLFESLSLFETNCFGESAQVSIISKNQPSAC